MRRRRIEIASPWRRPAAGVVNAIALLVAVAGAIFGWVKLGRARPSTHETAGRGRPTERQRAAFGAIRIVGEVELRNLRGPGGRLLGIRRADARTGGPVSLRSAIVLEVVSTLSSAVSQELTRPLQGREADRLSQLSSAIKEIQRTHSGDPEQPGRQR